MGPRVGGCEFICNTYQTPKMELFAGIVNGYFRKKLHLMFEIHLKAQTILQAKRKVAAMKVVFSEGAGKI